MAEAVDVAALHDPASVDRALAQAATAVRFGQADVAAIPHRTRLSRRQPEDSTFGEGGSDSLPLSGLLRSNDVWSARRR
jgi:hypothetical protein